MAGRWEAVFNKDNKGLPVPLPKLKQHTPNPFNDVVESTSRRETINISKKILDNIRNPIREYIVTENGEVYIPKQ